MKRSTLILTLLASCLLFAAGGVSAGWYFGVRANAISREAAIGTAFTQVGSGDVLFSRLLRSKGKAIWDTEITQPGKPGIAEVRVHAMTGEVIEVRHEAVKKTDEELSRLAQKLGITSAHLAPKVKPSKETASEGLPPLSAEDGQPASANDGQQK